MFCEPKIMHAVAPRGTCTVTRSVVCLGEAFDDCLAEADACVARARADRSALRTSLEMSRPGALSLHQVPQIP